MNAGFEYDAVMQRAFQHAKRYLETFDDGPVSTAATPDQIRSRIKRPLPERGTEATQVIDELVADVADGLVHASGGRFFAWVVGGYVPASLGADWLTSTWDQNGALYALSPAEAVVEETCGEWIKQLLGLPETASFALLTGCQMAHVTCLAAARHAVLERHGWDVEQQGLFGAPRVRFVCGDQVHGSVERALRLLGFGSESIVGLPVDDDGRLRADALAKALQDEPDAPTIVHLQAGELNTGAFDPFTELVPIAHAHNAWVHVDGAFGLWANTSAEYRHLLDGVGTADSWATDGHKWLNVPYDAGYAFVAHPSAHRAAMAHRASYLVFDEQVRDQMDWNPEWSRRARGFVTYAAIRELGRAGIAKIIEQTCRHARELVARIGEFPGAEVLWAPQINQGLVRFLDERPGATDADHDRRTDQVIAAIRATGEAFFYGTTWRGKRCMRVSVSSWQTTEKDIDRTVAAVRACLETASESPAKSAASSHAP